ncbi:hypothetical protein HYV79_00105 [Candidatus Woesearchaeota archaeon]|nr:hypothetical protein [Candidatus Woesearchaeota archaeon]
MKLLKQRHPNYFEGIIQLRNPSEEIVDYTRKTAVKDARAVISKIKRVKNGLDMYVSSQKYVQTIGKKIKEKFPGILKVSATLHTQKKGKDLYRVTVLFRYVPIKTDKIIKFKGEDYIILSWEKKVRLKHAKSGKKIEVSFDQISLTQ